MRKSTEFHKNQELMVRIEDLGRNGEGIGHADGYTLFIKDAVPGDLVLTGITKAGADYGYARVIRVIEPSADRVVPPCPQARRCGGCQLMALSYEAQLRYKEKLVRDALKRIGGFSLLPEEGGLQVLPVIASEVPLRYRNKAQYPVRMCGGKITAGFYAQHSHDVVVSSDCLLSPPEHHEILMKAVSLLEQYHVSAYDESDGSGLVRHILIRQAFTGGDMHVCFIINGNKLPHAKEIAAALMDGTPVTGVSYCVNTTRGNKILGEKLVMIAGEETIEETIGHCRYRISPLSFFQVNPAQTRKLYDLVREYAELTGQEHVYDLYCGAGTIGIYLADGAASVTGIEIVPRAIENARENAALNGIENARYYAGAAEDILPELPAPTDAQRSEGTGASRMGENSVVIVDPPRKGCDRKLLETILQLRPAKMIYVSCDPATLARDLRILADGGYDIRKVQPVDCFSMSVHVETVVCLSNKNAKLK